MEIGIITVIVAQALYSLSDAWKKALFNAHGFNVHTFLRPAFIGALLITGVGFLFQMHALSKMDLSRTIVTMGMVAVILSSALGILIFNDKFTMMNYFGVGLAIAAIILVHIR